MDYFYREKLPKFNNNGKMIFNCIDWEEMIKQLRNYTDTETFAFT